jgi:hypothetical protein
MASIIYNRGLQIVQEGSADLDADTLKVMLLTSSYTPDKTHNVLADVSTNEVTGSGYTAGGATLANVSVTEDDVNDRVTFDADDVTWTSATITARYAVIYDDTLASDPLLFCFDFVSDQSSSGADFTIQWNADGIFRVAQA